MSYFLSGHIFIQLGAKNIGRQIGNAIYFNLCNLKQCQVEFMICCMNEYGLVMVTSHWSPIVKEDAHILQL